MEPDRMRQHQSSQRLGVRESSRPGVTILEVDGELDLATADDLTDVLRRVESTGEHGVLVVLDGLEFMDSTGLSVAVAARRRADVSGRPFAVVCSRSEIVKLFRLTGLHEHIPLVGSLSEGLEQVGAG